MEVITSGLERSHEVEKSRGLNRGLKLDVNMRSCLILILALPSVGRRENRVVLFLSRAEIGFHVLFMKGNEKNGISLLDKLVNHKKVLDVPKTFEIYHFRNLSISSEYPR